VPDGGQGPGGLVAVLDIGKTNLKVLVATSDGRPVESLQRPNDLALREPYLAIDIIAVEDWFLGALAELGRRHPIRAVVATAHGCGAILCDEDGPVLPMMDYECPTPAEIDAAYAAEGPDYREVLCSTGPGASRLAKQLLWQSTAWPERFVRGTRYMTTAQYIAGRLGGRPASEISQMAAQGHLWDPVAGRPAEYVRRRGWDRLFPPFARAGEVLGRLRPDLAARTGLPRDTAILCGVHDSNANLFRYKAAGLVDRAVLSTGTWMIAFVRGRPLSTLVEGRAMVSNVDVDGEPVASTLTMTGREYAIIAGEGSAPDDGALAAVPGLLERGTMAFPSFVADDGPFPGAGGHGRIEGPVPASAAERRGLAALYAAFTAHLCLEALGTSAPVVIDGGFATNLAIGRLLAALRPQRRVEMSRTRDGTALGAALLWGRFERVGPVATVELDTVPAAGIPGLAEAFRTWQARADSLAPPR
jgi:sugar (pentulose or hexulose) kinase